MMPEHKLPRPPSLHLPMVLPAAVAARTCARWLSTIDTVAARLPPTHADAQPLTGSLRLRALGDACFDEMLQTLAGGPAAPLLRAHLGPRVQCLVAQCWARRQHAPALRPPGQYPHQWHQDGALACRFTPDAGPEALADLVTLWLPLVDCGDDAPSLEWITEPVEQVLPPADLNDSVLSARYGAARQQARLAAGDALLFGGALLHRSHVTPTMTRQRVSVELRFIAAGQLPARLGHEPLRDVML